MTTGVGAAFVQSVLPVLLIGGLGYLPGPVAKASHQLAGGAVAAMLLLVGLQLARLTVREEAPGAAPATAIRLLAERVTPQAFSPASLVLDSWRRAPV